MEYKQDKQDRNVEENDFINDFEIDEDASRCSNGITTSENEEGLIVKIDLHDFEIDFNVFDNILVIFGKRKKINDDKSIRLSGRRYKAIVRPILLPHGLNTDKIHKETKGGITYIKIPKNDIPDRSVLKDVKHCALCKFRECLCNHFPVLSEIIPEV